MAVFLNAEQEEEFKLMYLTDAPMEDFFIRFGYENADCVYQKARILGLKRYKVKDKIELEDHWMDWFRTEWKRVCDDVRKAGRKYEQRKAKKGDRFYIV